MGYENNRERVSTIPGTVLFFFVGGTGRGPGPGKKRERAQTGQKEEGRGRGGGRRGERGPHSRRGVKSGRDSRSRKFIVDSSHLFGGFY